MRCGGEEPKREGVWVRRRTEEGRGWGEKQKRGWGEKQKSCFFFRRLDERDQSVTHAQTKRLQAQVPVITDHFRGGSRRTVRTLSTPTLQQRQRESFGSIVREEGRPAVHPCLLGATSQDWRLTSCFGFGQVPEKKKTDSSDHLPLSGATGVGSPSRRSGDTKVVSTASWAPWNRGNPSTTTSILRLSNRSGAARSMFWTLTFRPPASRRPSLRRTPHRTPCNSTPPPRRTLHGGGNWNRVDGHTGRNDWTRVICNHRRRNWRTRNGCGSNRA